MRHHSRDVVCPDAAGVAEAVRCFFGGPDVFCFTGRFALLVMATTLAFSANTLFETSQGLTLGGMLSSPGVSHGNLVPWLCVWPFASSCSCFPYYFLECAAKYPETILLLHFTCAKSVCWLFVVEVLFLCSPKLITPTLPDLCWYQFLSNTSGVLFLPSLHPWATCREFFP